MLKPFSSIFPFPNNFLNLKCFSFTSSWLFHLHLLLVALHFNSHPVIAGTLEDLVILDRLLKNGYDRRATPTNHLNDTTPTKVYCELYVRSFSSPNPQTMDYKVDLYLRQQWLDERLKHPDIKKPLDLNDPNLVKAIWKPEVYFPNAKDADFQYVTVPNVLIRIHPDGTILYMLRLKVTFSCMMDLSKFPLDRQICTMEVASFSKTVEELILAWKPEEPVTRAALQMTQFSMVNIVTDQCHESFQIGNYSCLVAEFHLARLMGFHLVQSYLPTILMVVISWVSFWMDVNSVPGRVTLGITTLLTVSSKATNIQENIESSYVKAIDVWMGACTAFVFLALMEFTIVNYLWRKDYYAQMFQKGGSSSSPTGSCCHHPAGRNAVEMGGLKEGNNGNEPSPPTTNKALSSSCGGGENSSWEARFNHHPHQLAAKTKCKESSVDHHLVDGFHGSRNNMKNYQELAKSIDEACRLIFPVSFAIFIILYWTLYLFM